MLIIDKDGVRLKGQSTIPMPCTKITGMKMDGILWPSVVLFLSAILRIQLKASWNLSLSHPSWLAMIWLLRSANEGQTRAWKPWRYCEALLRLYCTAILCLTKTRYAISDRLRHLNSWSPFGRSVWKWLKCGLIWKSCVTGWALGFQKTPAIPSVLSACGCGWRCELSAVPSLHCHVT